MNKGTTSNIRAWTQSAARAALAILLSLASMIQPISARQSATRKTAADADAVTKWLKANAIPLKSLQAGMGFEDLQPMKKVLKDVKVVGLGEATHSSREFFQFKHRMLEFLVKEMGFTVFAIEAGYPECLRINEHVLYGKGDKAQALANLRYWVWDSEEMLDLIEWVREYNKTAPENRTVKFLGFDMQSFWPAYSRVSGYLKRVAPTYHEKLGADYIPPWVNVLQLRRRSDEEKLQLRARINEIIQYLTANRDLLSKASSEREYEEMLHCARIMDQFAAESGPLSTAKDTAKHGRDYYMARNIEYILNSQGPNTKVLAWAHNGHISPDQYSYDRYGYWSMGRHLRQIFGNAYYALGFSFNRGTFNALNVGPDEKENQGPIEFTAGPASEPEADWYFAKPGIKTYVIDFRFSPKTSQVTQWLGTTLRMKSIGATYNRVMPELCLQRVILKDDYDGIVFCDTTTRARLNPAAMQFRR